MFNQEAGFQLDAEVANINSPKFDKNHDDKIMLWIKQQKNEYKNPNLTIDVGPETKSVTPSPKSSAVRSPTQPEAPSSKRSSQAKANVQVHRRLSNRPKSANVSPPAGARVNSPGNSRPKSAMVGRGISRRITAPPEMEHQNNDRGIVMAPPGKFLRPQYRHFPPEKGSGPRRKSIKQVVKKKKVKYKP